jgi:hypothetical protein
MQVALEVPKQTCVAADKMRSWALARRSVRLSLQNAEERLEVSLGDFKAFFCGVLQ